MLDRLRRLWRLSGKSASPDPVVPSGWETLSGALNWTPANEIWRGQTTRESEAVARQQATVFACLRRIYTAAAEAPLEIGLQTGAGWQDLQAHPLHALIDRPTPEMSYAEWLPHVIAHLQLTGESYIWKWRNVAGYLAELWPIPTSWVHAKRGGDGQVLLYQVDQGRGRPPAQVLPRDLLRILLPDPEHPQRGLGPLQAALRDVQMDQDRQDYQMEMLDNSRPPGQILRTPNYWSEEQKAEIRAVIQSGLGRGQRGKTLFLEGEGVTLEQNAPLKDFDWPGLTTLSETRICACFGVSPILLGLRAGAEAATYANYAVAERSFYRTTMAPLWKLLDASLTRGLLRAEGDEQAECYHDVADVRGMQDDDVARAQRAVQLLTGGAATIDEARALAGLEPLPQGAGRVLLRGTNTVSVPVGQREVPLPAPQASRATPHRAAPGAQRSAG